MSETMFNVGHLSVRLSPFRVCEEPGLECPLASRSFSLACNLDIGFSTPMAVASCICRAAFSCMRKEVSQFSM